MSRLRNITASLQIRLYSQKPAFSGGRFSAYWRHDYLPKSDRTVIWSYSAVPPASQRDARTHRRTGEWAFAG
jgi:hypothetical protein